ncbi:MAG: GntR family transcriptional regulator [Candidatus Eremiobacteraeota bacterium]|nr:GntR family transcriptional regulator [Candidatus Eremiobacteraeota bacterium]
MSGQRGGTLEIIKPLSRDSIVNRIADSLSRAIAAGDLTPGERIVEIPMAERFGVSRGSLREALKILVTEGVLELRPDRGVYVAKPDAAEIGEMIVTRAVIEGVAARLFAASATPAQHEELAALCRRMEVAAETTESTGEFRKLDWDFHEYIVQASGNRYLIKSWTSIRSLLRLYMMRINPLYETAKSYTLDSHRRFLAVLSNGSALEAERAFRRVILETGFKTIGLDRPAGLVDGEKS